MNISIYTLFLFTLIFAQFEQSLPANAADCSMYPGSKSFKEYCIIRQPTYPYDQWERACKNMPGYVDWVKDSGAGFNQCVLAPQGNPGEDGNSQAEEKRQKSLAEDRSAIEMKKESMQDSVNDGNFSDAADDINFLFRNYANEMTEQEKTTMLDKLERYKCLDNFYKLTNYDGPEFTGVLNSCKVVILRNTFISMSKLAKQERRIWSRDDIKQQPRIYCQSSLGGEHKYCGDELRPKFSKSYNPGPLSITLETIDGGRYFIPPGAYLMRGAKGQLRVETNTASQSGNMPWETFLNCRGEGAIYSLIVPSCEAYRQSQIWGAKVSNTDDAFENFMNSQNRSTGGHVNGDLTPYGRPNR